MKNTVDCSEKIKLTGHLAVACNAFAAFGILVFDFQSGGHGEMGSFYHSIIGWVLLFAGWGVATGIGLLRAWRWARISTLIFSGLLAAAFSILGVMIFLHSLRDGLSAGDLTILLFLIPIAIGVWWLVFFTRKDVKAYFQA
jgi:hypothetical protein